MSSPLESAIALGLHRIRVSPCNADKSPACKHGFKDAEHEEAGIRRLWRNAPNAPLVAAATGEASGFDVLDIDVQHGGDKWLAEHADKISPTRIHKSRSGGWHYLFLHAEGLRCSTSRIATGVDVRADGGSAIWWPAAGFPVVNTSPIAQWPEWLIKAALPPPRPSFNPPVIPFPHKRGYAAAAVRKATDAVASAAEGTRNHTLNREAFSLLRFVGAGELSPNEILVPLAQAALSVGLDRREVTMTLESALRARGIA